MVKADGLAAGKGVLVTDDRDAALAHAEHYLRQGAVLVEEFLDGQEVSLFLLSDGTNVLPLSPGAGLQARCATATPARTPAAWAPTRRCPGSTALRQRAASSTRSSTRSRCPRCAELAAEGTPFIGLLYCGLILTPPGIRVIEFNARFGDPETQVVLPRLATPLSAGCCSPRRPAGSASCPYPKFSDEVAVTVVLASEGYPEGAETGGPIDGLDEAAAVPGVCLAHAATAPSPATGSSPPADACSAWWRTAGDFADGPRPRLPGARPPSGSRAATTAPTSPPASAEAHRRGWGIRESGSSRTRSCRLG